MKGFLVIKKERYSELSPIHIIMKTNIKINNSSFVLLRANGIEQNDINISDVVITKHYDIKKNRLYHKDINKLLGKYIPELLK